MTMVVKRLEGTRARQDFNDGGEWSANFSKWIDRTRHGDSCSEEDWGRPGMLSAGQISCGRQCPTDDSGAGGSIASDRMTAGKVLGALALITDISCAS